MKINDIVYYVNEYRVIKCVIESIIIKEDATGIETIYTVKPYNKPDGKKVNCVAANLVKDFNVAKTSSLTNWERITNQVKEQLENLSEKDFETA